MSPEIILEKIKKEFPKHILKTNLGETFFYYPDVENKYFISVKEEDTKDDNYSNLDRHRIYRLNFLIKETSLVKLFGAKFNKSTKTGPVDYTGDFQRLDTLMPHPRMGNSNWVCILNPSKSTFDEILPLINESYKLAKNFKLEEKPKAKKTVKKKANKSKKNTKKPSIDEVNAEAKQIKKVDSSAKKVKAKANTSTNLKKPKIAKKLEIAKITNKKFVERQ